MAQSGTLDAVSTPATSMVILILGPHPPSSALQVAEVEGGAARPGVARRPTSVAANSVRIESDGMVAEGRETRDKHGRGAMQMRTDDAHEARFLGGGGRALSESGHSERAGTLRRE